MELQKYIEQKEKNRIRQVYRRKQNVEIVDKVESI